MKSSDLVANEITLRELRKDDIQQWHQWFNNGDVTQYMNKGVFPNTEVNQEAFFKALQGSKADVQFGIVESKNDRLVGVVGIHKIDWVHRHGDVSILIGESTCYGKGYGKKAIALITKHGFSKMNLHKLTAGTCSLNLGAEKCFLANGYREEGVRRKQFFYQNDYVDIKLFGILNEEWMLAGESK